MAYTNHGRRFPIADTLPFSGESLRRTRIAAIAAAGLAGLAFTGSWLIETADFLGGPECSQAQQERKIPAGSNLSNVMYEHIEVTGGYVNFGQIPVTVAHENADGSITLRETDGNDRNVYPDDRATFPVTCEA